MPLIDLFWYKESLSGADGRSKFELLVPIVDRYQNEWIKTFYKPDRQLVRSVVESFQDNLAFSISFPISELRGR